MNKIATNAGDHNRADHFFSMPGARADRWRALHSAAQAWAKGRGSQAITQATFDELGAYEDYFAYPGRSLIAALGSWRTASVALLSFSSGMPLGLVWYAIPDWMRDSGVDIRLVGLFTLAQAPWAFKVVWSPLMDRYVPPFWGRRRGWMAVTQIALAILTLSLSGVAAFDAESLRAALQSAEWRYIGATRAGISSGRYWRSAG